MSATHFSEADFSTRVLKADKPVLVDFYADWCGPCRAMAPIIEELAGEFEGKITIGKLDVDQFSGVAETFQVMSIPTMILFTNGKVAERWTGVQNKTELSEKLKAVAAK